MNTKTMVALMLVLATPVLAWASSLNFRNDTPNAIVVQTGTLRAGRILNDQPQPLRPGMWSRVTLSADKSVTIYEGNSNRILYQSIVTKQPTALHFSIQPDPQHPGKVRLLRVVAPPER
jgi:hypothetical protein